MNCCNDKHDEPNKQQGKPKGHMSHMLMMILCCALPMGLLLLLPFISSVIPGSANILRVIIPFLCPVMMIAMIPMMTKGFSSNKSEVKTSEPDKNQLTNGTDQQSGAGGCH